MILSSSSEPLVLDDYVSMSTPNELLSNLCKSLVVDTNSNLGNVLIFLIFALSRFAYNCSHLVVTLHKIYTLNLVAGCNTNQCTYLIRFPLRPYHQKMEDHILGDLHHRQLIRLSWFFKRRLLDRNKNHRVVSCSVAANTAITTRGITKYMSKYEKLYKRK